MADIKNILTGASGLFTSILGLASNNPAATASGLTSFYSILSPTQRSMVQYGSNQALAANQQYNAALQGLGYNQPLPIWVILAGVGFVGYLLFKRRRR